MSIDAKMQNGRVRLLKDQIRVLLLIFSCWSSRSVLCQEAVADGLIVEQGARLDVPSFFVIRGQNGEFLPQKPSETLLVGASEQLPGQYEDSKNVQDGVESGQPAPASTEAARPAQSRAEADVASNAELAEESEREREREQVVRSASNSPNSKAADLDSASLQKGDDGAQKPESSVLSAIADADLSALVERAPFPESMESLSVEKVIYPQAEDAQDVALRDAPQAAALPAPTAGKVMSAAQSAAKAAAAADEEAPKGTADDSNGLIYSALCICTFAAFGLLGYRCWVSRQQSRQDYRAAWRAAFSTRSSANKGGVLPQIIGRGGFTGSTQNPEYQPL